MAGVVNRERTANILCRKIGGDLAQQRRERRRKHKEGKKRGQTGGAKIIGRLKWISRLALNSPGRNLGKKKGKKYDSLPWGVDTGGV